MSSTITSVENGIAEKSSDKAKSDSTVDDDEVPGSAGYKSTYSNSASGTTGNTSEQLAEVMERQQERQAGIHLEVQREVERQQEQPAVVMEQPAALWNDNRRNNSRNNIRDDDRNDGWYGINSNKKKKR